MTDMMKSSCHGKFNCSVEAEQNAVDLNLFTDPECYKPKQELSVEYICGEKSFLFSPKDGVLNFKNYMDIHFCLQNIYFLLQIDQSSLWGIGVRIT